MKNKIARQLTTNNVLCKSDLINITNRPEPVLTKIVVVLPIDVTVKLGFYYSKIHSESG
jgi:hypothetical protein